MAPPSNSYSRPFCAAITVPDPDNLPVSNYAEVGKTLEWRSGSHNYPDFEIRFQGLNPFNATEDLVLKRSDEEPAVIRLNTIGDNYESTVRHYKKDGTSRDTGIFAFNVNPCRGCPLLLGTQ